MFRRTWCRGVDELLTSSIYYSYKNTFNSPREISGPLYGFGKLCAPQCPQFDFHFSCGNLTNPAAFVPRSWRFGGFNDVALGSHLLCRGLIGGSSWFYWNRYCGGRCGQDSLLYFCDSVRLVVVGTCRAPTLIH